jgi:hypothetical protein
MLLELYVFPTCDVKDSCWFWFTLPKVQVLRVVVSQNHPNRRYQQTTYGCSQCVNYTRRRPHC